jgi:L,D-transpeptidase ErfK/SrfK
MSQEPTFGTVAMAALLFLAGCAPGDAPPESPAAPVAVAEPIEPAPASSAYVLTPGEPAVGSTAIYITRTHDTLLDVARQYDLGYTQLMTANRRLDPWNPGVGQQVTLPAFYLLPDVPHRGIVINLVQQRLFYFPPGGATVETYPIGVGVQGRTTPLGLTHIVRKETHPVWRVPPSIRAERPELPAVVAPGPDNPLGDYAMLLGWPSYLIHDTNRPYGVGRNVSHGCIHLYPEDIAHLFDEVPVGTEVRVIDQEVETGWVGNDLYVAVFPNKRQADALDVNQPVPPELPPRFVEQVKKAMAGHAKAIDWQTVASAGRSRTGIPVRVTLPQMASTQPGS